MATLNLDNIVIVLVETISPGNVGSVARAIKNMGISNLRLVNPKRDHLNEEARRLAHGALDTLEQAKVFSSISDAISDCTTVVATSHKPVRYKIRSYTAREIGPFLIPYCTENKVAILFGREDHGLNNDEIKLGSYLLNIPTYRDYPAINLSKAVMLVCYELFMTTSNTTFTHSKLKTQEEMEKFYGIVLRMINQAGFRHKNNDPSIFMSAVKRIFNRSGLEEHEMSILIKLFSQFDYLDRNNEK